MTDQSGISRRKILAVAAGAAGAVSGVAAIVGTSMPALAAKASQKSVKYQDTPKGEARCENCTLFDAPNSCKPGRRTHLAGWLVHGQCEETGLIASGRCRPEPITVVFHFVQP